MEQHITEYTLDKIPRVSCHILCGLDPVPLSKEYMAWDKKRIIREYLSHLADLIVILLRDGAAYVILVLMTCTFRLPVWLFPQDQASPSFHKSDKNTPLTSYLAHRKYGSGAAFLLHPSGGQIYFSGWLRTILQAAVHQYTPMNGKIPRVYSVMCCSAPLSHLSVHGCFYF